MFYNGFTLLMQILAGITMYHVGRSFGAAQGERDMYQHCAELDAKKADFYSQISQNR